MIRSLYDRVRVGFRVVRAEARHGAGPALRALSRVAIAATGRRSALDRYRNQDGRIVLRKPPKRPLPQGSPEPRILAFKRYLVGRGRIVDAAELLNRAHREYPHYDTIANARAVVLGERTVLGGSWAPPAGPLKHGAPKPGRVAHIVGRSLPDSVSGFTVRTHRTARSQQRVGLDPVVITKLGFPEDRTAASAPERYDGVPYHRLDGAPPQPLDARLDVHYAALAAAVSELQPGLLHAHSDFQNGLLALALRHHLDTPVVYEARGFWEETWLTKGAGRTTNAERYRWRRDREVEVMHRADRVVTLAPSMANRIIDDGIDQAKITVIPNAVDPDEFPVAAERDPTLSRDLRINDTEIVVGYVSSLVGYEGIDLLVAALAQLVARGLQVRGLIVGDGGELGRLRALSDAAQMSGAITFTGGVPPAEAARYYSLLDIFVVPRRDLSVTRLVQPLKPYEALSVGLPLIVSDLPALVPIVNDSGAGITFTPNDIGSLADAIQSLAHDPARRAEMGKRGANWVRSSHTWDHNAARYAEIYRELGVSVIDPAPPSPPRNELG